MPNWLCGAKLGAVGGYPHLRKKTHNRRLITASNVYDGRWQCLIRGRYPSSISGEQHIRPLIGQSVQLIFLQCGPVSSGSLITQNYCGCLVTEKRCFGLLFEKDGCVSFNFILCCNWKISLLSLMDWNVWLIWHLGKWFLRWST